MQIDKKIELTKPESEFDKTAEERLIRYSLQLSSLLNGGLRFSDNFDAQIISITDTGLANTEFSQAHTIKRVPAGFIVLNNNKAGIVYDSGTAWTSTAIYLKCSVASCTIKILVF